MAETKAAGWWPFNINEYARVKLTESALAIWREDAQRMRAAFPHMAHLWPDEPRLDPDGYYRDQLWSIMGKFAPLFVAGGSAFEGCILELEFQRDR